MRSLIPTVVLLLIALPLVAGCNRPCQTYCGALTDYIDQCIDAGAVLEAGTQLEDDILWSWTEWGATSPEDYHRQCMDEWEVLLQIAKMEDRNMIYDWCTEATMEVAATTRCDTEITVPKVPDIDGADNLGDEGGDDIDAPDAPL